MVSIPRVERLEEGQIREMDAVHAMLASLAWNVRFKLVVQMACEPGDVTRLAERLGFPVCTVSRHLAVLREMGLVIVTPMGNRRVHGLAEHVKVEHTETRVRVRVGAGTDSSFVLDVSTKPEARAADLPVVTRRIATNRKRVDMSPSHSPDTHPRDLLADSLISGV